MRLVTEHGSMLLFIAWMMSGSLLKELNKIGKRDIAPRSAVWIYHELKPFAVWLILIHMLTHGNHHPIANLFEVGMYSYFWYLNKDADDDDRWKKRIEKASGIVKSLGHKLVIANEAA